MTIGQRIRELRKEKGLYQEELANLIGVARQTVASWELDRTIPNMEDATKMTKVFNCDLEDISGTDMRDRMKTRNEQEFLLLENFRNADKPTKEMVMRMLKYANMDEVNNEADQT
jgi:DNA-binding XRE family transcriptional regulator